MDERERRIRKRLKDDLPYYSEKCLKIRAKNKKLIPLRFNKTQEYIHKRLEEQKAKTGKVRALILKGRKQGASTYVTARFYHKTSHTKGYETVIMAHEDTASQTLFKMANRFHDNCPALVKPLTGKSNAKQLSFPGLDSGYEVLTAGSQDVGRSKTPTALHGSEAAFWKNAETHMAGIIQAIPYVDDTEVVLESTANGVGGQFHIMWQNAERGIGDYIAIFAPWHWPEENRRPIPEDYSLSKEDEEYQKAYGLDDEQMAYRRAKIDELGEVQFKQEYPANAHEAFQVTGHDSYITPSSILKARKATHEPSGPLVIGVDPARSEAVDADAFGIARRRGRKVYDVEAWKGVDTVTAAYRLKDIIDKEGVTRMFIDAGGLGIGVIDVLHSFGDPYTKIVVGVNFGGKPRRPERYLDSGERAPGPKNRRAEMYMDGKDWLEDELGADIPDDDVLQSDACSTGYSYGMNQVIKLETKKQMKKRGIASPDRWDAVALTFAEPVANTASNKSIQDALAKARTGGKGWMSR